MSSLSQILINNVIVIEDLCSVKKASKIMEDHKIGGLPVVQGEKLIGIITSRDIRNAHPNRLVADTMTRKVVTCDKDASIWDAITLIENNDIERLLITENNEIKGIITKKLLINEISKNTDSLTGLYKANYLKQKAKDLLIKDSEISLVFFDLDNFREINKNYGHSFGDYIIKVFAEIMVSHLSLNDYVCRYAGDEFAIVTTKHFNQATLLAEKIAFDYEQKEFDHQVRMSVSVGIAGGRRKNKRAHIEDATVNNLINLASMASTSSKNSKNKISVVETVLEIA